MAAVHVIDEQVIITMTIRPSHEHYTAMAKQGRARQALALFETPGRALVQVTASTLSTKAWFS